MFIMTNCKLKPYSMEKYEINSGKILTRKELKNIKGGGSLGPPGVPNGADDIKPYKCCRTGTNICSACVECTSKCTCGAGATLTVC